MALAQGGAGVGAEPVGEALAYPLVQVEGVGLAALGGQRVHLQRRHPLVHRTLGEQGGQPGGGVVGAPQRQLRLGQIRGRLDRGAGQPRRDRRGDRGDHRRFAAEQRDRLAQRPGRRPRVTGPQPVTAVRGQPLEPQRVDVGLRDAEAVAALGPRDRAGVAEQPAQPGDQRMQRVRRIGRELPGPQRVDQDTRFDRPAAGQRQPRDQAAKPVAGNGHRGVATPHLERAEQRHPQARLLVPVHRPILPHAARRPQPAPPACARAVGTRQAVDHRRPDRPSSGTRPR